MVNHQKHWIEVKLGAPGPGMIIFIIFSPKLCPRGRKNGQNGKKKIPLEIPIMMLNHQKNWIEVNLGAPGPGMIIFPNFSPKLCSRGAEKWPK